MTRASRAIAEASTILTGIPIGADHAGRLRWGSQSEPLYLREEFVWIQPCLGPHRFFQNGQKLTLEGTMMPSGLQAQPPHNVIRGILDR
ncbi:MAG TPA: hypothetical protein VEK34_04300 [Methylocella sp.]|nr:hypothetical protein [Methylocella sp.]